MLKFYLYNALQKRLLTNTILKFDKNYIRGRVRDNQGWHKGEKIAQTIFGKGLSLEKEQLFFLGDHHLHNQADRVKVMKDDTKER